MSDDFVTQLRLQLREAALREERRAPFAQRLASGRWRLPGPAPIAAALAVAVLALAVALGSAALRGEPEPAEPEVIGTHRVASGLSALAPGFGAVWTADPIESEILRIDPTTRRVVARIPVPGQALVATSEDAVWALAGDLQFGGDQGPVRVLRIDPDTDRVVARIPLREGLGPIDLHIEPDNTVWVIGLAGAERIDPSRNAPDRFVPLADEAGEATRGVVPDGDRVWMLTIDGALRQIDARDGRVVSERPVPAPADSHLFGGPPGTLTLTGADAIARIERETGRRLWQATLDGEILRWTADDDVIWAHVSREPTRPDRLVALDADSGSERADVELPEPGVAGLARVGDELWVATGGGSIVVVKR